MSNATYSPFTYIGKRTISSYKWDRTLTTVQWVEQNVRLNADASPITGLMNLKFTPHLRVMFDDYDKHHVWKQIGKFSTQTAKTTFIMCVMAKRLDTKPVKLQYAIPNEDKVTPYIEDKIDPFLKGIKSLNEKIEDHKQREKARLKRTRIKVAGGDCVFTGTSASSKRSKTVREIYMDEADLFSDGSLIELEGRTKASEKFGRKVIAVSSQSKKNGEIAKAFTSCETIKEWHTPCEACGHHWLAGSKDLKWMSKEEYSAETGIALDDIKQGDYKTKALKDVYLECPECNAHITTEEKDRNILDGKYNFYITQGPTEGKTIGYSGNALAMYFTTFQTIAALIIDADANGTFDDMAQIYLDYFDEIYQPTIEESSKNDILLLSNNLKEMIVPSDTYRLYLTIDTQKDGFWFKVTAARYGNILSTVNYGFVSTFDELELLMGYRFEDEDGKLCMVDKTMIDRMGIKERTAEVDAWIEYLIVDQGLEGKIFPSMGIQNDASGRLWYETTLTKDVTTQERKKTAIKAIRLNNTLLKNELSNLITRAIKKANKEDGYEDIDKRLFEINQSIVDAATNRERSISTDYERQMTSENYVFKVDTKTGKVASIQTWEKRHNSIDNHLWDCSVMAVACSLMDNISLAQKPSKDEFSDAMSTLGFD